MKNEHSRAPRKLFSLLLFARQGCFCYWTGLPDSVSSWYV